MYARSFFYLTALVTDSCTFIFSEMDVGINLSDVRNIVTTIFCSDWQYLHDPNGARLALELMFSTKSQWMPSFPPSQLGKESFMKAIFLS